MSDIARLVQGRRAASNAAIAAKDAAAVAAFMTDDVTVAVAGGPVLVGRLANQRAFAAQMAERGFRGYVRTPTQIDVGEDGRTVRERGTWAGHWQVGVRLQTQGGTYSAEWQLVDDVWYIASEIFVGER